MQTLKKYRNRYSTRIGHALLRRRQEDRYIAAYPRSGSTWLRTILSNVLVPNANGNPSVFNQLIPAVSIRNAPVINRLASPRLIMTHRDWQPEISKAVYLVRDGRDALISSYHYYISREQRQASLDEFWSEYMGEVYGPLWHHQITSWLKSGADKMGDHLLVVYFEALKNDTHQQVRKVCDFLDIEYSQPQLDHAIEYASLENARAIERQNKGELANSHQSFYRDGASLQWKNPEYEALIRKFESLSRDALELARYGLFFESASISS